MWKVASLSVTYSKKPKNYLSNSESQVVCPHLISTAMTLSPDLHLDYSYNITDTYSLFSYRFDLLSVLVFALFAFLDLLEYILIKDFYFSFT